jgi:hypothetical protein
MGAKARSRVSLRDLLSREYVCILNGEDYSAVKK